MNSLDTRTRSKRLQDAAELSKESPFDLLVIGGGATGAGIALDSISRGMSTVLLEKVDFAWGTSSRSTKLIHGGLRYLKQLDVGLVREVGRERAIVHRNAPHIAHPEELLLPIVENGSLGKYSTPVGLWVYEKLAGVKKDERFYSLDKREALVQEPLLNERVVRGGAIYREYRTDDARLVTCLAKTASKQGASLFNYTKVTSFIYEAEQVVGVRLRDEIGKKELELFARTIINAAGPWCDEVRSMDTKVSGKRLQLTKGSHLVFSQKRFPIKRAVYFDVRSDERMVFAIPRGGCTYLGTTDTLYQRDIDNPRTSASDVDYLLAAANHMFPGLKLTAADVESTWVGLRPLIHEDGKGPTELSRKDEIFNSKSGLISIAGGKLTGYRIMAERAVDQAMATLTAMGGSKFKDSRTEEITLDGGDFAHYSEVSTYKERLLGEGDQISLSVDWVHHLVDTYGKSAQDIVERAYELHPVEQDPERRMLRAEVEYSVECEACASLCDFLIRRTGRLYFQRPALAKLYPLAADLMATHLGWTDEQKRIQILDFESEYEAVMSWQEEYAGISA